MKNKTKKHLPAFFPLIVLQKTAPSPDSPLSTVCTYLFTFSLFALCGCRDGAILYSSSRKKLSLGGICSRGCL